MPACDWPEPIRAILFDAGNTLVHLDHEFIAETARAAGFRCTAADVHEAEYAAKQWVDRVMAERRAGRDDTRRQSYFSVALEALGVPPNTAKAILRILEEANAADCLWRVVTEGTHDALAALRTRGYTLGVVSNADGRIERDLGRRGLRSHFTAVIDSAVVGVEKPDPRIFALGLEAVGAPAAETLYVGDIYSIDILGAEGIGMSAVLLDPLERYPAPCRRIPTLATLLDVLPENVP